MSSVIHRRSDCRACGSSKIELVLPLKPTPIGDAFIFKDKLNQEQPCYPLDLYLCNACGLAQIIDVINPDVLYGEYIYQTSSSLGLEVHFEEYANSVIQRCKLEKNALIVDIGSNDGTLLSKFKSHGMNVLGIEPSKDITAIAMARGVNTVPDYFSPDLAGKLAMKYGRAKAITANNVFANIDDLMSMANAIAILLAEDGVFILESSYLPDLIENMVFDFIYHEHLSSFSLRPIQALFKNVGMEVAGVQHVNSKGGSLRYFIQRPGGPLKDHLQVEQLLAQEDYVGIYTKKIYSDFESKIEQLKQKTRNFLINAKREKKTIAGFGACITGTTLIYHFEIGEFLEFIVDDNIAKQGRFSPGLHLPVLPVSSLSERRPDYVIALAWRYATPFIQNNRDYIASGGQIIIPAPEFRVVNAI